MHFRPLAQSGRNLACHCSSVTDKWFDSCARVNHALGFTTPVGPVLHKPSIPSVDEIVDSTLQFVLCLDLLALGLPMSSCHLIDCIQTKIALFHVTEWEKPEHIVDQVIESATYQIAVLVPWCTAILIQAEKKICQLRNVNMLNMQNMQNMQFTWGQCRALQPSGHQLVNLSYCSGHNMFLCWRSTKVIGNQVRVIFCIFCILCISGINNHMHNIVHNLCKFLQLDGWVPDCQSIILHEPRESAQVLYGTAATCASR